MRLVRVRAALPSCLTFNFSVGKHFLAAPNFKAAGGLQAAHVASGNSILAARLSPAVHAACRHGCGAGLREFSDRGAQSVTGSARAPVTLCT